IKGVSRLTFLKLVGGYAKGKYADFPKYINHVRSTSIEIDSQDELVVNVDGEIIRDKKVCMKVIPGGVNFIFPAGMEFSAPEKEKAAVN
ncbi:MAG: hypothetical protein J6P94_05685, partial [Oscillospiraceae bacterium]|nr:hypothetical protein [Oscillospiraceae bacterium]